jgi:uncharacterized membrane protein
MRGAAYRLRVQWTVSGQFASCILYGALSKATSGSSIDTYWLGMCFGAIKAIAEMIDVTSPRLG